MKHFVAMFLIGFFVFSQIGFAQEEDIQEDMVVVNVEVPVRVKYKGKLVDNLKKSDFKLYEDGKQIDINGFNIVRKKISSQKIELDSERRQVFKPRFFVLAFSVTNFNRFYKKGVEYFFEKVLRKGDNLLVFVNNTTLSFNDLDDKNKIFSEVINALNKEGKTSRRNIRSSILTVENGIARLLSQISLSAASGNIYSQSAIAQRNVLEFFVRYKTAWENYKRSFLKLNIYTLYNFAAFLKRIKFEKWVISFYQYEKFPMLDFTSENVRKIKRVMGYESRRIYRDIHREFIAESNFPHEEVSKLFYNLGTTFNLVVIPTRIETDSAEVKAGDIPTAIENTLREISKKTGGSVNFSTDLSRSLEKIVEKEDVYYLLTYAPKDNINRGKLKVSLSNNKYNLIYDNNQRAGFIKRQMEDLYIYMELLIRFHREHSESC